MSARTPFADRAAFILNANARAVNDRVLARMSEVVPASDLFLSRSLEDAERICRLIARRGYGQVFTGGGDGTLVSAINYLQAETHRLGKKMPEVGVLRLGTGNAVAGLLKAARPEVDALSAVEKVEQKTKPIWMVKTDEGTLAPFAGVGYDGEILNDYIEMKEKVSRTWPFLRLLVTSVFGYLVAMLFKTVPRRLFSADAKVRMVSRHDAFKVLTDADGNDYEVRIPAGTLLYEGPAPVLSVGTVPFFGGGFTMFPHALRKEGYMQVRVVTASIPKILANLWPSIWNGSWRDKGVHDFLVKDVEIVGDRPLDYQVGGDAAGQRDRLSFEVSEEPVDMVVLGERKKPATSLVRGLRGLLPA